MVVNPQTFNYRLIIGILLVAMISLGAYSLSSYNELREQKEFLAQEKKIVENELSQIITRYDELMSENEDIKEELMLAKERTLIMLDSLKLQEASVFIISKYRNQINFLNDEREELLTLANSLKKENHQLHKVRKAVVKRLEEQTDVNTQLSERNMQLAENVKKGSVLKANSFSATALRTKISGKQVETNKAKRTDVMEICFTLAENSLAEKGEKNIYIQVLNPNSNVIGQKLSENFGDYSLIYSTKTLIDYDNDVLDVCVRAKAGKDEKIFTKGTYFVNVFHDEKKLGSTKINLN